MDFKIDESDFEKAKEYFVSMVVTGIGQELSREFIWNGEEMVDTTLANYIFLNSGTIL